MGVLAEVMFEVGKVHEAEAQIRFGSFVRFAKQLIENLVITSEFRGKDDPTSACR